MASEAAVTPEQAPGHGIDPRPAQLRELADGRFDVIVIGGGINGAGIARDAGLRGLRVALLERNDFGFGTTWRSTKLIHGGLRYLEHGELRLVYEGLHERATLLRIAPHLVRPLPFLVPVYRGARYPRHMIRAGLMLYDLLATGSGMPHHRAHSRDAVLRLEPTLSPAGLTGGLTYYDAQVALPERLCLENVLDAQRAGAQALNHIEVTEMLRAGGKVAGVRARDAETGGCVEVRAPLVVNAAGPWVDRVLRRVGARDDLIGGTRGSHIVVDFDGWGPRRAIYTEARGDGRPFFIIPWRGRHLIGTTDLREEGDPGRVLPKAEELAYLRRETARVLPGVPLRDEAILYAFTGVRPLARTPSGREGAITRRHFIRAHDDEGFGGLFSIVGGKLTSFRALAQETVDLLFFGLGRRPTPCTTAERPLVAGSLPAEADALTRHLVAVYGARAQAVTALARVSPELAAPLCGHGPDIVAQAVHAVRYEGARTVADVLLRRTPAGWNACRGVDAAPAVAQVLGRERGWDGASIKEAVNAYRREVDATLARLRSTGE